MFFVVCAHMRHPAEGIEWIKGKPLAAQSANADIDTQRERRGVVAILSQTGSSALVGDYYDKNRGDQRCVRQERQIGETTKRLVSPLHWRCPDATFCWGAPRCC